jgi:hypothetical protein
VLRRINDHPAARLAELLPWNWKDSPCQTGGMSPPGSSAAFDSFNEIATVRIELRATLTR